MEIPFPPVRKVRHINLERVAIGRCQESLTHITMTATTTAPSSPFLSLKAVAPQNSFANLDETRVVTTPRSLLACELEGIIPEALIAFEVLSPRKAADSSVEGRKKVIASEHRERERKKLVVAAKERWQSIKNNSRMGSAATRVPRPPAKQPQFGSSAKDDGGAVASDSARRKFVTGMDRTTAEEALASVEDDDTVAQYFLQLKSNIESMAESKIRMREREVVVQDRYDKLMTRRKEEADEKARQFEEHLSRVMQSRQQQLERFKSRHEQRVEQLQQRQEVASKLATEHKQARSNKATTRTGADEREAAEQAKREKIALLESKLEAANQAALERKEKKAVEDSLRHYETELKQQALESARQRAVRSQQAMQRMLRERELESFESEKEESLRKDAEQKARYAAREIIAKQRQEVARYVTETVDALSDAHGSLTGSIEPPAWLADRVRRLEQRRKSPIAATSPRRAAPEGKNLQSPRQRSLSDSSSSDLKKSLTKDKFTIASPKLSERQVFGKWMFE